MKTTKKLMKQMPLCFQTKTQKIMKKTILFTILALLGMTQAAAQEYEYVPFVREGVKWVYYSYNPFPSDVLDMPEELQYYCFEMKGDTVYEGKHYKPVKLYYINDNGEEIAQDYTPIWLREENKVVYGIHLDGLWYPQCPVGIGWWVDELDTYTISKDEFILYDFNDPEAYYQQVLNSCYYMVSLGIDTVRICNHYSKRLSFNNYLWGCDEYVIEGIGCDGGRSMPLCYFPQHITGPQVLYGLSHVIEDGEIIYKSKWYKEPEPDGYEYVPFVREGVKWVYYYLNDFSENVLNMPEGFQYYSFEMGEDVLIGEKYYKPVYLTHYLDKNGTATEVEDFIPIYLREENKVVYAIHPDGIQYPQCPVGIYQLIGWPYNGLPITTTNDEFVLYDFNDPKCFYDTYFDYINTICESEGLGPYIEYEKMEIVPLGNHQSKCYYFNTLESHVNKIIEGVGFDGNYGMPLFYFERLITGFQVQYYLSHVIEDGEIIFKGIHYHPDVNGDVNGDGEVTIADANNVVDIVVMGGNSGHNRAPQADVNGDGEVNIADVNAIIDIIIDNN